MITCREGGRRAKLTEVGRTSTAQPTTSPGISWTYLKDMTEYLYFWKSPQKIIFDLGNLISISLTRNWQTDEDG